MKSMKSKKIYIIILKCRKCSFLRNLTKTSNLVVCFSEIPKFYICVCVMQVTFLSEDWKKFSVWSSVLFAASTLKMHERKPYIKQTGPNAPVFSTRSALYKMADFCRFHTLSQNYLEIPKSQTQLSP